MRYPFYWLSYSKDFRVRRWYHRLCVPPSGHRDCEEGGCRIRTNCRSQGQFWQKRRFAVRWLDGKWYSARALAWGVVRARSPTGAKFLDLSSPQVKPKGRRKPTGEAPFVRECRTALRNLSGSSDLSRPWKELYRELVVSYASEPLSERHGWTVEEVHFHWAPGSGFLNNSEFSLTWWFARNALPLLGWNFRAGLADMPDYVRCGSGLEETAKLAFYYCERVLPFSHRIQAARIESKQLVLLDVGYVVDNLLPLFQGEKRVVFLAILAVARMGILTTWKKDLYDDANFFHRDLILFFRHQHRVKIRCDRKCLDCITFDKRWVNTASLVVRKGAMLESFFPPVSAHGVYGPGPSGPHPG